MRLSSILPLAALAAASPLSLRSSPAPLYTRDDAPAHLANTYIVKFKQNSAMQLVHDAIAQHLDGKDHTVVQHVFQGFVASLDSLTVELLRLLPDVEHIEQDSLGKVSGQQLVQSGSAWGLARISHRDRGHNDYLYDGAAGAGTCVYVLDTGVEESHPEFEGRAHQVRSFVSDSNSDDNGHGTHVAGTVGSRTYGVAKKTTIFGVKVADKNGSYQTSNVIAGLDFVASDSRNQNCPKGVAINMSLYGKRSDSFNNAVNNIASKGIFVSVCSGNDNKDAADYSPASATGSCTVGGSDSDDKRYDESNFGPSVSIVAPAVFIESTFINGGTATYSGTSMAAPHIAGLAAYLASKDGNGMNNMCSNMVSDATKNAIVNQSARTVNLIAFNGGGSSSPPVDQHTAPAVVPTTAAPAPKPTVVSPPPKPTPTTTDQSAPTWWPEWFGSFW